MYRRSTRHVVIGGLAIAYGAILGLFWGSVVQGVAGIRDRIPPLGWIVLAALAMVPVLLVVTGSRLCRVVAGPSPGLRSLIALTTVVLLAKALLVGLLALSAAGGSSGSYYRGGETIGGVLAVLVVTPSVVAAVLLA